jgi:hypothetical protein
MMGDVDDTSAVGWVERVMADLTYRAPFGVVWHESEWIGRSRLKLARRTIR